MNKYTKSKCNRTVFLKPRVISSRYSHHLFGTIIFCDNYESHVLKIL